MMFLNLIKITLDVNYDIIITYEYNEVFKNKI